VAGRAGRDRFAADKVMNLVGKPAPDFVENAVTGEGKFTRVSLRELRGKWVVLFFYPADFTFICPTEISDFSRRAKEFEELGAVVLGCSADSRFSHREWIKGSLGTLTHPLIADFSKRIARQYECLDEDTGYPLRATYIIDPDGDIVHAQCNIARVGRSVDEILRLLRAAHTGELTPVGWKPGDKTLGKD
jgi:alkyl hydroperoxide reductase subunit AhpC